MTTTNTPDDREIGVLLKEAAHSIEASREVRTAIREHVLAEAKREKQLSKGRSKGGGEQRALSVFLVRGGLAASVALAAVWLALSWSGSYANADHALRSAARERWVKAKSSALAFRRYL